MARTGWFVIGVVAGPFGIKGEAKVHCLTDLPERYKKGLRVLVGPSPEEAREMKVAAVRWHKGMALVKFEGLETISEAEGLRGYDLFLPDSERAELPEGQYYDDDLLGLEVVTDDGRSLGPLRSIVHNAANDLYEAGGVLIPAVSEFVRSVDLAKRQIVIHSIPGLLDED